MQVQERLIVPGLGIVILLSAFILGVPLVYKLLLGLLGLAAAGTYFAPPAVQVETRAAIAAVGLIILLIGSSVAFWLTLLSFGAIAALQFPHRRELQRNPATIAWLGTVLKTVQARRSGRAGGEAGAAAGDGESGEAPEGTSRVGNLPGFVRANPGGIGSTILGVIAIVCIFMPWIIFEISSGSEAESQHFSLWAMADPVGVNWETSEARPIFFGLLVLGLASAASIVLPRVVVAVIAIAGAAFTIFSYFYLFAAIADSIRAAGGLPSWFSVGVYPSGGAWLALLLYLCIFVLQLVPAWNRSQGKGQKK